MNLLARLFFYGYAAMLLAVGASGIFIAAWELPEIFAIDLEAMSSIDESTFLNQYRFLKAMELGFGIFCIVLRREIFAPSRFHTLFLVILATGAGARLFSVVLDGVPRWPFLVFIALEVITGILVWMNVRHHSVAV